MRQRLELSTDAPPAPAGPAVWLDVTLSTVEENLALDEALLELAHDGLATATCVRTWMAAEPTIVLGSSSRVDEEIDLAACKASGVRVVRRPSGGATVVLGPGCLMWSVIAAHPEGVPAIEAIHAAMLEPLAAALNESLLESDRGDARRVARRGTSDLAVRTGSGDEERKVSGNALRVRRHGVLYHGTLLDSFDLGLVGRVLRHPPREPDYRSRRSHGDFLTNLGLGRERIERIVRAAFNATVACGEWPRDRVARLVAERYAASEWTGRL
ncbi:MAG: biotin/lipoate A/B protein ligase family protein [Planctomycetia bacterium]